MYVFLAKHGKSMYVTTWKPIYSILYCFFFPYTPTVSSPKVANLQAHNAVKCCELVDLWNVCPKIRMQGFMMAKDCYCVFSPLWSITSACSYGLLSRSLRILEDSDNSDSPPRKQSRKKKKKNKSRDRWVTSRSTDRGRHWFITAAGIKT